MNPTDQIAAEAAGEHKHQDLILARNVPRSKAIIKSAIEKATSGLRDANENLHKILGQKRTIIKEQKTEIKLLQQANSVAYHHGQVESRTAHSFAEAAERKHAGEPLVAQGYLQGERASIAAPVTAHASVTTNTKAYEDGTITPAHASEQEKWIPFCAGFWGIECGDAIICEAVLSKVVAFAIADAHNATLQPQSDDTKRLDWLDSAIRNGQSTDIKWPDGNKPIREAIDTAMSQTKEGK